MKFKITKKNLRNQKPRKCKREHGVELEVHGEESLKMYCWASREEEQEELGRAPAEEGADRAGDADREEAKATSRKKKK